MVDLSYQAGVQPEGLPGRAIPRLPEEVPQAAFGGEIGRSLENVGSVVQEHVDAVMRQAQQTQLTDAHNQLQAVSLDLTHNPQSGAFTKQGKDAFNLGQQYLPQFDQASQKIIDGVPDPKARQAATLAAAQVRDHLGEQLDTHELEQHRQFGISTAKASIALAQQTGAANYNHPDILATNKDHIDASLESLGQQQGWSDDQLSDAKQESHSAFHTDVVERMLGDDKTQMADVYLKANKNELDARTYESLASHIAAKQKEQQNEQKQDIADRFNDSMEAAQAGLTNPVTVSRKEMDVLYPKDAQRRWDGLQSMAQAGAQSKEYDQMTPEEIQADLDARRPTQGGPEAAFQLRSYGILSRAAEQSLKSRTSDPAQFAIDSGAGWQPLNLQNPQNALAQLRSRANTQQDVTEQVGVPVPLLSKPEAKQFTQALATAKPSDAAAMLAQLRQTLPDERSYGSVLDQIAPHSPVLAVAGSLTNAPPKASAPSWYDARFAADPQAAAGIIDGQQILSGKGEEKAKGGFVLPPDEDSGSKSGLATTFRNEAGGDSNNLFQGRPQTAELYYDAFKAYYAHLAAEKGITNGQVDPDLAHEAAHAVLGDTVRFNHTDISVPHGMDPTRFRTLARTGIADAAQRAGVDPALVKAGQDSWGLAEIDGSLGSGRYAVVDGNGRYVAATSTPQQNFERNKAYTTPSGEGYQTHLSAGDEGKFQSWVKQNNVPFDSSKTSDYDMRGFWKALQDGDERAKTAINQNDHQMHFPDTWKTPYHQSFSAESQWATSGAPKWNGQDQLVLPNGNVVFDERGPKTLTVDLSKVNAPPEKTLRERLKALPDAEMHGISMN